MLNSISYISVWKPHETPYISVTRRVTGIIFRKAHSSALGLIFSLRYCEGFGLRPLGGSSTFTHPAMPVYHAVPRTKMYFRGFRSRWLLFCVLDLPALRFYEVMNLRQGNSCVWSECRRGRGTAYLRLRGREEVYMWPIMVIDFLVLSERGERDRSAAIEVNEILTQF